MWFQKVLSINIYIGNLALLLIPLFFSTYLIFFLNLKKKSIGRDWKLLLRKILIFKLKITNFEGLFVIYIYIYKILILNN